MGYWMIRTIKSGKVVERSQFFVGERRPRADRRKGSSTQAKQDRNQTDAVRRLARVVNCNFGPSDLLLTLTYADEHLPQDAKEADRQAALFLRRLKRAGVDPKVVWITADKDKAGKPERLHHHAILEGASVDLHQEGEALVAYLGERRLEEIWGKGHLHAEHLRQQDDYTPLASYMVRQAANAPDAKKWHASRGMAKPIVESERITSAPRELRAPGGAEVLEVGKYDAETGSHYIRYIRRPKSKAAKERSSYMGLDWAKGPYAEGGTD